MPIAKGKGGSASHRYRPASEYDDATLAQKREYWRNKKREQRARLSERRGKPALQSRGEKLPHLNAPAAVHSSLSSSLAALSSPLQSNDESYRPASQSANRVGDCSHEATENQKEKWFQTMSLNKVLPPLPVSCSISGKAAGGNRATNSPTVKAAVRAVTSTTSSGTQLNTSSSVPLVRVTRITNGSSAKIAPQPCASMQGPSVPQTQHKAQVALPIQPKRSAANVTTGMILVSSPCVPVSIKTEGKTTNTTPQSGIKRALVPLQRTKGAGNTQPSLESEEERAAKRREHWRIKKREQRAKLAARVAKARERAHGAEMTFQRLAAQKTGTALSTGILPPQSLLKGAGQKQASRVKTSFISVKREKDKLQSGAASVAITNLQADQIKVENTDVNKMTQTAITSDFTSARTALALQRKLPSYGHLSNVTRGIARCKTPRQRFIDAQKNFMSQRNLRCKSPLVASMFGPRSMPKIDPNDTPEQIIAKRREYWRIKKREQRAKLSMEVKARLKEKDSLMRRVKRYQKILEDIRKARAMTHLTGSTLTHASETIGGFIKEDGTLTVNILHSPTDHNTAEDKNDEDLHVASKSTLVTQSRHQQQRSVAPVRINQPNPPLRPVQVKVSVPLAGQSVNKSPRLLSIRPRTQLESTTVPNSDKFTTQGVGQLKLTHPQTSRNAVSGGSTSGSNLGGCVMKMAVSSSAPSLSALSADPELGEEEKMARKREYWRIKKREQRAARAVRLKQGAFQARASPVLERKKAQKQVAVTSIPSNRSLTNYTGNVQPLSSNNSEPVMPHANEIKQESESMPAVDLNSQPEQAICPDIKPPASPPPRPAPQPEPDPALSADSQAATLLAVASMKKLLEESLSTVTDCNREQPDIKTETKEDASEQDMKPNLPQLFFQKDDIAPIAANLTLQIKSWQPDSDGLEQADSPNPQLKSSPEMIETPPPLSASTEVVLQPTCEHSSQTALNFIVNPSVETSDGPSSPRRTQRRTKKAAHQNCCSPKLHHATAASVDQLQPQQQHCEQHIQAQEQCLNNSSPSVQRYRNVGTEQCGLTSLQRKREYWKMMKRQQRARLRARQKERHGECSSRLSQRNIQAPGLVVFNTAKAKPTLWPKPSITSVAAVNSIPTVLVVSPTTCNSDQTPDTLQVKLPVTSRAQNNVNAGLSQVLSSCAEAPEPPQLSQEWTSRDAGVESTPSLPTLKPPDNPLSSINLQPIEPLGQSPNPKVRSPRNFPDTQVHSPTHVILSPSKLTPTSTLVPPKQTPGESDEDFLRRKREYWRIKKKEQRARKAIRDKGIVPRKTSNNWTPILPAPELQTQDSGQWVNSCEEPELRMSSPVDTDPASFPYVDYSAPVEDESELLFPDYEINNGEESPVSDTLWRNRYLMDYDPLNQLLVCMVCGELQYSHSLEGVRAHIDEAHPHTLNLEAEEKQGILDAWDEQVSQRERFFTSQLQQHSGALAEAHGD